MYLHARAVSPLVDPRWKTCAAHARMRSQDTALQPTHLQAEILKSQLATLSTTENGSRTDL